MRFEPYGIPKPTSSFRDKRGSVLRCLRLVAVATSKQYLVVTATGLDILVEWERIVGVVKR